MNFILKVGAIGDAVMCLAALDKLKAQWHDSVELMVPPFLVPLLERTAGVGAVRPLDEAIRECGWMNIEIEIGDYLSQNCHVEKMPGKYARVCRKRNGFGHLVTWIGNHIGRIIEGREGRSGDKVDLVLSPDDVKLTVTFEDLKRGKELLAERLPNFGKGPTVLICPEAGSPNRVIPHETVNAVSSRLSSYGFVVGILLGKVPEHNPYTASVVQFDLADLPGVSVVVDNFIGADTGPTHIAAAARQGMTRSAAEKANVSANPMGVIWVTGSSNPECLRYKYNLVVKPDFPECPWLQRELYGCGFHSYTIPTQLGREVPLTTLPDNSACIDPSYAEEPHVAPCMASITPQAIIKHVNTSLGG